MNFVIILGRIRLIAVIILVYALSLSAAVPTTMNYQGYLTDDTGQPISDGDYAVTFTIYDGSVGGNVKWSEVQTVSTTGGLFATDLGSVNPILDTVFSGVTRFLGIKIEDGSELSPRTALVSVPFAMRAPYADSAGAVADGGIDLTDIGQNGASNGKIMKWNGSAWAIGDDISGGAGWNWSDSSSFGPDTVGTATGLALPLVLSGNSTSYIFDITNNGTGSGLASYSHGTGYGNRGLFGHAKNGTSSNYGVVGQAEGDAGVKIGLNGHATGAGTNTGSYALAENGEFNYAFSGVARGPATNYGGEFKADSGIYNIGVYGRALGTGTNMGGRGRAGGGEYNYAMHASIFDEGLSSYNYGLYSSVEGAAFNYGIYAKAFGGHTNYAGYFDGDVGILGNTSILGGLKMTRINDNNVIFEFDTDNHRMKFYEFNSNEQRRLIELSAFTGGEIKLFYESDTSNAITELGAGPNGGEMTIRDQHGNTRIFFLGNNSDFYNNDRVVLHEGSVDDVELMNEPGIVQDRIANCHTISSTTVMEDVVTVTINIPAPGYIFLNGHGLVELSGTVNAHRIKAQIDETAGGSFINGYYTRIGLGGYVSAAPSAFSDFDLNCQRTYYKDTAGIYTFRLEALKESSNSAKICFASLTATYFPTSYGTVSAISTGNRETVNNRADINTPTSDSDQSAETVDLRREEMRAREFRRNELDNTLKSLNTEAP